MIGISYRTDAEPARIDPSAALPELFEGATFTLDASVARQAARLARYVRAYGGLLLEVRLTNFVFTKYYNYF